MNRMTFYDYLKEELIRGGLWEWIENRPYREVIVKPEILFAHERAWKRFSPSHPQQHQPQQEGSIP